MIPTLRTVLAVVTLTAIAAGCRSTVNTVENLDKAAMPTVIRDARIVTDAGLDGMVAVTRLSTAVAATGVMRLQVELENLSSDPETFNLLLEWYDGDGMRVFSPNEGWQQIRMMARESRSLVYAAPNPTAKDFRIKLLELND